MLLADDRLSCQKPPTAIISSAQALELIFSSISFSTINWGIDVEVDHNPFQKIKDSKDFFYTKPVALDVTAGRRTYGSSFRTWRNINIPSLNLLRSSWNQKND